MDAPQNPQNQPLSDRRIWWVPGVAVILIGLIIFADQFLHTGWLSLLILPAFGALMLAAGVLTRRPGLIIPGSLLTGLGAGAALAFTAPISEEIPHQIGAVLAGFALGWFAITLITWLRDLRIAWWATIPGTVIAALAIIFLYTPLRLVDFVFYLTTATALIFLTWGVGTRLLGLIITGGVLFGIGPGIYFAWSNPAAGNGLTQTGTMLVCFAVGWALITLGSRMVVSKFLWWPLIPGGILAVTGWGLYIGGNPNNALHFIGNTGSLGLILLGVYLLVWRWGFRK
ncbi:MAG: hypothetical protein ABFD44_07315 [Anaerolineaceae bacterium]